MIEKAILNRYNLIKSFDKLLFRFSFKGGKNENSFLTVELGSSLAFSKGMISFENSPSQKNEIDNPEFRYDESTGYQRFESILPTTAFGPERYFTYLEDPLMPYNNVGSCAFVSLIGVLSFYDTFFNDNIIPDFFENHFRGAESFTEDFPSPGVQSYRYTCQYPSSQEEAERAPYRAFVYSHQGDDLQCALTRIHNQTSSPSTDNDSNFQWSCGIDDYQTILNNFYNCPVTVNNHGNECSQTPQGAIYEQISSLVDQGLPVIVSVFKSMADPKKHAVIAYAHHDGTIWANYGMRGSTHVPLLDPDSTYGLGYDCIEGYATISFPGLPHRHSNNYEINGVGYCGCNLSDKVVATEARENCPPLFPGCVTPPTKLNAFKLPLDQLIQMAPLLLNLRF